MPRTTTVRIEGLRELGEAMRSLKSDVALKAARSATAAAAAIVKKAARENIVKSPSVRTGSLRDSVIVKRLGRGETDATSEHIVTVRGRGKKKRNGTYQTSAPHAHFVEFGTVDMPAEPFLRPAFDAEKENAVRAMADRLRARIEKAGKA